MGSSVRLIWFREFDPSAALSYDELVASLFSTQIPKESFRVVTTDHRNLKKTPRRNEGCGDSSLRRGPLCFTSKAIISDVSHREFVSRLCAGVKRTVSGPFTGRPSAQSGRWDSSGLVAINWQSWVCSIPREESRKLDTGSHNSLPRKHSEPWLSRGCARTTCVPSPISRPAKASLPLA